MTTFNLGLRRTILILQITVTVILLPLTLGWLIVTLLAGGEMRTYRLSRSCDVTSATVTDCYRSSVSKPKGHGSIPLFRHEVEYEVDGIRYSQKLQDRSIESYSPGSTIDVYYSLRKPSIAQLSVDYNVVGIIWYLISLVVSVLLLLGLLIANLCAWKSRKAIARPQLAAP